MFLRLLAGYNSRKLVSVSSILPSKSLALISIFKKKKLKSRSLNTRESGNIILGFPISYT